MISGQAFLKTRGGDVKFGAANDVYLNPVTAYSLEWYTRKVIGKENLEPPDPRAKPYHRVTTADGSGNFRFGDLPSGEYIVVCDIFWEIPGGAAPILTGAPVHAVVRVGDGEEKKVILKP